MPEELFCCDCAHADKMGRFCQRSRPGFSDGLLPCVFEREGVSNNVKSLLDANGPDSKFVPCGSEAQFFKPRQ